MKIRFLIQARLLSERLPEKVLAPLGTSNVLLTLIDRLNLVKKANCDILLALAKEEDQRLIDLAVENNITYQSGDPINVLQRFMDASRDLEDNDYIFRFTADNPFVDMQGIESLIHHLKRSSPDFSYVSGYPLGMAFEAIKVNALRSQSFYKLLPHHTEHVTTFIKERPELYTIEDIACGPMDDSLPIRLTIDEPSDLQLAQKVYKHFERIQKPYFGAAEVALLYRNHPEFFSDNAKVIQKSAQSYQVA